MDKKKLIKKVLSLGIVAIMVFGTVSSVFATNIRVQGSNIGYNKTFYSNATGAWKNTDTDMLTVNGTPAFCLQSGYGISGFNTSGGDSTLDYTAAITSNNSTQNKIAYLGYYGASRTVENYAFTQMYLWQSMPSYATSGNATVYFTDNATNAAYTTWKNAIERKIATWDTVPSFDNYKYNTTTTVKAGESGTLTDTNGVLADYKAFTYTKNGVTVTHTAGSNILSYSAANGTASSNFYITANELKTAGCQKYESKAVANYVYTSATNQDIGVYGATDPIGLDLRFDVIAPTVGTSAVDGETNDHIANADDDVTITDTVTYTDARIGKEYTVKGTLMNADTGEAILVDGEKVTAETTFTAEAEDGTVDVVFTFDGSALAGTKTVVFEDLYQDNVKVATHADLTDEGQTVDFPSLGTTVIDSDTQDHIANADKEVKLTDTVTYTNLIPEKEYTVKGTLMDKETGKAILVNGQKVTAETTFTAEAENGTVDVVFTFDGSSLQGKTTVVFEDIYYGEVLVGTHSDINDENQTIRFPSVKTTAIKGDTTITDIVKYTNLTIGEEYTVKGTLMDSLTGKPILMDGKEIVGETTFVAEDTSGQVEVSFTVDKEKLAGHTTVVFETIEWNEKVVGEHQDITDKDQTVYFAGIGKLMLSRDGILMFNPKTGDATNITPYIIIMLVALISTTTIIMIKRKKLNK